MRIEELIKSLGISKNLSGLENFAVAGISCNSKLVENNFIFVAINGFRQDGNSFINEAIERGAKAVVVNSSTARELRNSSANASFISVPDTRKALAEIAARFYGNPSSKIKVVGVTGTNGKTTVTYLIEALLKEAKGLPSVIGTVNYRFKDKIIPSQNTTPGPLELQSLLSDMLREGIEYCLMEVSSHALQQARTEGINFHSAIFTNLTQDHLDYHKTKENYFKCKARLFKNISPDAFVVINNDDSYGQKIKKLTKAKVITYGIKNKAEVAAKNIKFNCYQTEFMVTSPQGEMKLESHLIGRHNVYNILAAVAWALEEGMAMEVVKSAIEKFSFVPGRLERINFNSNFSVFLDYAHTEDALKNVIKTLRQLTNKRVIVVFGCGGERDKTKRPKMGRVVSQLSDYAIITSDNPRSEDPQAIIEDIKKGITKNNYCVIQDRFAAIRKSLSLAKAGDIVLVAGKGHEDCQIIKDRRMHFSDREAIIECLQSAN